MSLSDRAYEIIRKEIITCELRPGQQVAQPQLAEKYGIGTTPVREALQRLAQEGLVEAVPRLGYIVTPITFSAVRELFELRSIIECATVRLAAVQGSKAQLEKISQDAVFTYVFRDRDSYTEFLAHNAAFHRSIAVAAGNQRIVDLLSQLLDELTRIFHLGLDLRDSAEEMRDEHIALAQALLARDPHRAEHIVHSQVARSQQRVLEALTQPVAERLRRGLQEAIQITEFPLEGTLGQRS
jgi:DNA-binding GntR family transcriptional regulator